MIKTLHISNPLNDKLDNYISNYAKGKLALKQDCRVLLLNNDKIKYVLVEGGLDKKLFKRLGYQNLNNEFIVIDKNTFAEFGKKDEFDSKVAILNTIVITNLKYLENGNIYGIVDKDFDEDYPTLRNNRVASDIAHDLEMMLVSTDDNLLKSIFPYDADKFNTAKYMAYQLAVIKYFVSNTKIHPSFSTWRFSYFYKFFDKEKLDIRKFVNFINNRNSNTKKHLDYNLLIENLKNYKRINKQGGFKITYDEFVKTLPSDFYSLVNGHDLRNCFIINYSELFNISHTTLIDFNKERETIEKVDNQLIYNYQTSNFANTNLYSKLQKFDLNL